MYEKVLNEILQHIKRKFSSSNDIAKSLRTRTVKVFTQSILKTSGMRMEQWQIPMPRMTGAEEVKEEDMGEAEEERAKADTVMSQTTI